LATADGCTTQYISGIDRKATIASPAAIQDRAHRVIAVSFGVTRRPAQVMESTDNVP
jgi:hypothetical protein